MWQLCTDPILDLINFRKEYFHCEWLSLTADTPSSPPGTLEGRHYQVRVLSYSLFLTRCIFVDEIWGVQIGPTYKHSRRNQDFSDYKNPFNHMVVKKQEENLVPYTGAATQRSTQPPTHSCQLDRPMAQLYLNAVVWTVLLRDVIAVSFPKSPRLNWITIISAAAQLKLPDSRQTHRPEVPAWWRWFISWFVLRNCEEISDGTREN